MAQGEKRSLAIFIDKNNYSPAKLSEHEPERGVYAWRMPHWLSDYVGTEIGLPLQIGAAWLDASRGVAEPYATVANELAGYLFGAQEAVDLAKADAAKAALRKLVETQPAPIVLARLIGNEGRKLYVPLSLIAAAGNSEGVAKPFTVVQPLEIERYGGRCIQTWSFGMSAETTGLDSKMKPALTELTTGNKRSGEEWLQNNQALKRHLGRQAAALRPEAKGEGMVLVAHHDDFGVYFNDPPRRIPPNGFLRSYPAGSIALVASCAISKPNSGMAIINRLNSSGMDAMIVSPFKVRVDYGFRLAVEFTKVVRESRDKRLTPTLGEVFAQAKLATTEFFNKSARKEQLQDMGLEFVLIGNPFLRLCAP